MMKRSYFLVLAYSLMFSSCGTKQERPERIDKLRAIGVDANPAILSKSASSVNVILTTHLLLPKDQKLDLIEPFIDSDYSFGFNVENMVIDALPAGTEYGPLKHYAVQSRFLAAPATLAALVNTSAPLRLRYGVRVVSGSEEEKIVGDVLLVSADDPSLSWSKPTIAIASPLANEAVGTGPYTLDASISKDPSDQIKVSWFTSSGDIENRRAVTTKWSSIDSGSQLILATVRGIKSKGLALDFRTISNP